MLKQWLENMRKSISLIPDRLAHYRAPVFDNIARLVDGFDLIVYADLGEDRSGIRKPKNDELEQVVFFWEPSKDFRVYGRLVFSTGSFKAVFDSSEVLVIWGDAFSPGNWAVSFMAKIFGKKLVFWTHGLYGKEGLIKKKLRCFFYSIADCLLLYGQHSKALLLAENFSESKLYVINNALNVSDQDERFVRLKGLLARGDDQHLKIIFVGRLTKVKKLHLLLSAVRAVSSFYSVTLDIVGDGDQLEKLKDIAAEIGVAEFVNFHGAIYDEDVLARHIMSADVMVSPGNVGLTAMHSLVYGTPVISHSNAANQMPEFEAIRPAYSGELFCENNVSSLVDSIIRCKTNVRKGLINEDSCRKVLADCYSLTYQSRVFNECLEQGLGFK